MEKVTLSNIRSDTPFKSNRFDIVFAFGVVTVLVAAWLIGIQRAESDIEPFLSRVFPDAKRFEASSGGTYTVWNNESENPVGYIGIGTADGYGGELKLIVAVSSEGRIISSNIFSHLETKSYFQRVQSQNMLSDLVNKKGAENFIVGKDIDGVTGATVTCQAIADAARRAVRTVSQQILFIPVPDEPSPEIHFGWPEAVLILFFLSVFIQKYQVFSLKRALHYITLITGLMVLGFLMNKSLNLIIINKIILGIWPAIITNLYWYILLAGSLLFIIIGGTNVYCNGICPFGAVQTFLGMLGGGSFSSSRINLYLKWIQRGLALMLIVLALIYRNPGMNNYEISGTLFGLIGSSFHFGLLGAVIISSLFIRRFWCRGLCPVRPVMDSMQWLHRKIWRSGITS